ncbi:MAG: hypothetical protein NTV34_08570 [Proteobacteria bacterium]|nr:hypothetical protein [Pseudomonadota bacterium]
MKLLKTTVAVLMTMVVPITATPPALAHEGSESSGGGGIMGPIIPREPIAYDCSVAFLVDSVNGPTEFARASFRVDNKHLGFNAQDLTWSYGTTSLLSPFVEMTSTKSSSDIFTHEVRPYYVSVYFMYSHGPHVKGLEANLQIGYGVTKGDSHTIHEFSGALPVDSNDSLKVQGRAYANGIGELQIPYVFGAICEKSKIQSGEIK